MTRRQVKDIESLYNHVFMISLIQHVSPALTHTYSRKPPRSVFNPKETRWHRFIDELAYLCDSSNGGRTVCSIAVESNLTRPVFWLAAPPHSEQSKLSPGTEHLREILQELKRDALSGTSSGRTARMQITADKIHDLTIQRSVSRIKNYADRFKSYFSTLEPQIEVQNERDQALLRSLKDMRSVVKDHKKICSLAYDFRCSPQRKRLEELMKEHAGTASNTFEDLRHLVGRLGSFMQAARFLAKNAVRFAHSLVDCEVKSIPALRPISTNPVTVELDLQVLIAKICPWLEERNRLSIKDNLETAGPLLQKVRNLVKDGSRPHIHAELQMLQHFVNHDLSFLFEDRYIGCSKPSCYCCAMYMSMHSGEFEQRPCHGNAWLLWSPPLEEGGDLSEESSQIIKTMVDQMNGEVEARIGYGIYGRKRRNDTSTGMSYVRWAETATMVDRDVMD
ncbi:hypothetical protein HII31_05415 [Pseudocercospora fuligena]|uniref:Uncharacterized protein n=1 Tax=Pseudocercospora fuligena TaxID=685502 RepID=A0A8H6RLF0_9PEZI|nr:hypothetical protein HII31_05415 [Pseudocercospora fuligena]